MLRIPKSMLRKGMYIEAVECPTTEFSLRRFLLQSDEVLRSIRNSSASHLLVNCGKSTVKIDSSGWPDLTDPDRTASTAKIADPVAMRQEVSKATEALREEFRLIISGRVDLNRLGPTAMEIGASLEASPDIFLEVTRLKSKDEGTYVHSLAVSALMTHLGRLLELDDKTIEALGIGGLIHDVGKIHVPNAVLRKQGPLTPGEMKAIRSHPESGFRFLKEHGEQSQIVLDICRHHHEMLDGSGYPAGLAGDQLSLPIRICTVCDVFDALTSPRPYKHAWTKSDALAWMYEQGHLFDRTLVIRLSSIFE
jgi:putative nucleotidyltransferase with HDIG domain